MDIFNNYSQYYDLLYKEKDYQAEADYVFSLIEEYAPKCPRVIELGCGTGKHAIELAKKGVYIHGVDLSHQMLKVAKAGVAKELEGISKKITFSHGDVRDYSCDQKFDVVISLFHVLSYQTSNQDLEDCFKTAASLLKPGGLFLFDYWYGPTVLTTKPEVRIKRLVDDKIEVHRIAEPELFPNENMVHVNYTILVHEKANDSLQNIKETHEMRYLFLPEIEALGKQKFSVLKHFGWMKNTRPDLDDWAGLTILEYQG